MMDKPLVTVVVPIYNVEKYLERCVKSIINQTYSNLEILLIDDGSPDHCPQMCDEWAAKDPRIHVIHKKNAGLGMARNTGIENAHGKYIFFFDSDDYVSLKTVEKCVLAAEQTNADTVLFGFSDVASDGKVMNVCVPATDKSIYNDDEIREYILPNLLAPDPLTGKQSNLWLSACSSMFSMDLINRSSWRFVSEREIISEDSYFLLCLYKDVTCTVVVSEALYFYCRNEASLTHAFREDRFEKIVRYHKACLEVCQKSKYDQAIAKRLNYVFFSFVIGAMKTAVASNLLFAKKYSIIKQMITDEYLQKIICSMRREKDKPARVLLKCLMRLKLTWACYVLIAIKV